MQDQLKEIILEFIDDNYGPSEKDDPCYNIDAMVSYICDRMEVTLKEVK